MENNDMTFTEALRFLLDSPRRTTMSRRNHPGRSMNSVRFLTSPPTATDMLANDFHVE